jgi:hypothetical protein
MNFINSYAWYVHIMLMCTTLSTNPTLTYLDIKDDKIIIGPETDRGRFCLKLENQKNWSKIQFLKTLNRKPVSTGKSVGLPVGYYLS